MTFDEFEEQVEGVWPDAKVGIEYQPCFVLVWVESDDPDIGIEVGGFHESQVFAAALAAVKAAGGEA